MNWKAVGIETGKIYATGSHARINSLHSFRYLDRRLNFKGGTIMLIVTNVLIGIVIVVLFLILDRLGDIFYSQNEEHTMSVTAMTKEDLMALLGDIDEEE